MKALVYTAEKTLSYLDYDDTIQNPNEELIKIDSVGFDGEDEEHQSARPDRAISPCDVGSKWQT